MRLLKFLGTSGLKWQNWGGGDDGASPGSCRCKGDAFILHTPSNNINNNKYTNNYKIESPPHITKTVFFATPETNIEKKTLRNTIEERFERLRKPNKSYEKYVKKIIKVNNNDFIINNTKSPPRKIKKLVVFTTTRTTPNAYITKKKTLSMKEQLEILRKPNKSYEEVMKGLNATLNSLENTRN